MPHITLEYSNNITPPSPITDLFTTFNSILATQLPTDIKGCKCRAIALTDYLVGNGAANHAFIHLKLQLLRGRNKALLTTVGTQLLQATQQHFAATFKQLALQLSLEIVEFASPYFKAEATQDTIHIM